MGLAKFAFNFKDTVIQGVLNNACPEKNCNFGPISSDIFESV